MGSSPPSKTKQEKALVAAQMRELDRTQEEINEKRRRVLRSQIGGRGSLLSGSERGVREGEVRQMRGSGNPGGGRDLRNPLGQTGGVARLGGGVRLGGGSRR